MNTNSIDFAFLIDCDISPLIVFNHKGQIVWLNESAEILLGYADHRELFEIALNNASKDFGHKNIMRELHYKQLNFYAFQIAYKCEEWISIRLFYRPRSNKELHIDSKKLMPTNINLILEATISMFHMQFKNNLKLFVDQDIPNISMDQNSFSKLLRKALNSFSNSDNIEISLKMTIGEFIKIDGKRYPILRLKFKSNERLSKDDKDIENIANSIQVISFFEEKYIVFDIPFIKSL